jgi:hypothetical protein
VADLLRAHGTPQSFDALHVDVDGDELPLIDAILAAGFSPAAIALNINPDVPPPIQLRTRLQPRQGGRMLVGAEEPCDTWPCSTSELARFRAAGLSTPSADAAFHTLHGAGYSLLGFGFGRFSSWCLRCEHRMWWARADLISLGTAAGTRADAPTAYRQMVHSFWAQVYGAQEGPASFSGKLLAHSSNWLHWRRTFDAEAASLIAAHSWRTALLGQTQPPLREAHGPAAAEPPPLEPNATLKGWCLKADPCPLHAFTHAPPSRLPSLAHILNCVDRKGPNRSSAPPLSRANVRVPLARRPCQRRRRHFCQRRDGSRAASVSVRAMRRPALLWSPSTSRAQQRSAASAPSHRSGCAVHGSARARLTAPGAQSWRRRSR